MIHENKYKYSVLVFQRSFIKKKQQNIIKFIMKNSFAGITLKRITAFVVKKNNIIMCINDVIVWICCDESTIKNQRGKRYKNVKKTVDFSCCLLLQLNWDILNCIYLIYPYILKNVSTCQEQKSAFHYKKICIKIVAVTFLSLFFKKRNAVT